MLLDSAREYLIVDGHSVIFAWPHLRSLQGAEPEQRRDGGNRNQRVGRTHHAPVAPRAKRPESARDSLIKALTDYQDQSGVRVVLVFDGRGARVSEETVPGNIQIFYSPAGKTADDIIERLVAKYAATHQLTVATSDSMERQTVISFGAASCISAEQLHGLLEAARNQFSRRLQDHRRKK